MPFTFFHGEFPEIAACETRTISFAAKSGFNLPVGDYSFLEMFCDEVNCDCRRVFFRVVSASRMKCEAIVSWGWESRAFYRKWSGQKDFKILDSLTAPSLKWTMPKEF
jgi:hypothetical protein